LAVPTADRNRLIRPAKSRTFATMNTATVEQFQNDPASLLAAVEHGEAVLIARGTKPVARLLPVEEAESLAVERADWLWAAEQNFSSAYGPDEPEYGPDRIIEPNPLYEP
jgi:prevent-host-death family protein